MRTLREARATMDSEAAKGVRASSDTNCVSCECVRLAKITCMLAESWNHSQYYESGPVDMHEPSNSESQTALL